MSELENLPDGPAKDFLKKLSAAATLEDVRAIRLMILEAYPDEVSDVRGELLAYADDRLAELKKGKGPFNGKPVGRGDRR